MQLDRVLEERKRVLGSLPLHFFVESASVLKENDMGEEVFNQEFVSQVHDKLKHLTTGRFKKVKNASEFHEAYDALVLRSLTVLK